MIQLCLTWFPWLHEIRHQKGGSMLHASALGEAVMSTSGFPFTSHLYQQCKQRTRWPLSHSWRTSCFWQKKDSTKIPVPSQLGPAKAQQNKHSHLNFKFSQVYTTAKGTSVDLGFELWPRVHGCACSPELPHLMSQLNRIKCLPLFCETQLLLQEWICIKYQDQLSLIHNFCYCWTHLRTSVLSWNDLFSTNVVYIVLCGWVCSLPARI